MKIHDCKIKMNNKIKIIRSNLAQFNKYNNSNIIIIWNEYISNFVVVVVN